MNNVDHPSHYAEGRRYEPVDVIADWKLDFCLGSAVKYLARAGRKNNTIEDLEKAVWYINYKIEEIKRKKEEEEGPQVVKREDERSVWNAYIENGDLD